MWPSSRHDPLHTTPAIILGLSISTRAKDLGVPQSPSLHPTTQDVNSKISVNASMAEHDRDVILRERERERGRERERERERQREREREGEREREREGEREESRVSRVPERGGWDGG